MVPPPGDAPSSGVSTGDDIFNENAMDINHHFSGEGQKRARNNSNRISKKRVRAMKRKGDSGKAADILDRSRNYCRERRTSASNIMHRHSAQDASISSVNNDQYRIPPPDAHVTIIDAMLHLFSLCLEDLAAWVYAASFWMVLFFFLLLYEIFVWIFVAFLLLADSYSSTQCIANDDLIDEDLITRSHAVEYAFALSWTTFTTVGFGRIAPPGDEFGCYPVRFICSIEAIMGMGFVSMCSGIFYAKLLKFIGCAPVTFSSTLCVQYGKGLCEKMGNASDSSLGLGMEEDEEPVYMPPTQLVRNRSFTPYPVMEFRIVNNRANCPPGKNEIWDAQVTGIVELPLEGCEMVEKRNSMPLEQQYSTNKKINCDLKLSPSTHPYFCRTWFLRHVLDESSPLLKDDIRRHLKERGPQKGWDAKLNDYQDIRGALVEFKSIRIILSGSSALSKGEVYAEKTYSYDDVFIGWKFVGICIEDEDDNKPSHSCRQSRRRAGGSADETKTRVDMSLLHDICPQKGGNYEPMVSNEEESS